MPLAHSGPGPIAIAMPLPEQDLENRYTASPEIEIFEVPSWSNGALLCSMCACWGKVLVWEGSRDTHRMHQGCQTRVQTSVCAKRKRKKETMAWKSVWISSVFLVSRDIDTPNDNVRRFGKRKLRSGGTMWEPNYMGAALTWCGV